MNISQTNIDLLRELLSKPSQKIVVLSHTNPDGDAVGSTLAMCHFLLSMGKEAVVVLPNVFPAFLSWVPGADDVLFYDKEKERCDTAIAEADVLFCLDFNVLSRTGDVCGSLLSSSAKKVLVDHHPQPSDEFDVLVSHPEACSTCELVFRVITALGGTVALNFEMAQCIYTGMMTDTGGFTYNSNDREIYYIISELLSKGIDKDEIYRKVFNTHSEGRLRLMGYVLYDKMQVFPEFNSALIWLDASEQKRFQYKKGDTEGFVNIPLSIKDVRFSVFLREDAEKKMIKVSLRSVGTFPCNKVAAEFFNGGGHLNASGGEFYGPMEEAINLFKQALVKYQDLLLAKN